MREILTRWKLTDEADELARKRFGGELANLNHVKASDGGLRLKSTVHKISPV